MPQFRIAEAAKLLGVSDDTVRRWVEAGTLPADTDASHRKVVDGAALAAFAREHSTAAPDPSDVGRSARNRLVGLVTEVITDKVMAQVEMQCGPHRIVSLMSSEAVRELGLEPGVLAVAVIKSTNVVVGTPGGRWWESACGPLPVPPCCSPAAAVARPAGRPRRPPRPRRRRPRRSRS